MSIYKLLQYCCTCAVYTVSLPALSATNSSISLEFGADSNSGQNSYASGRHKFDNKLQLSASRAKNQVIDSNGSSFDSESYNVGLKTDPSALFSAGIDKSNIQQTDNLDIDSTILTLEMNSLDWNIFISPEWRRVSLNTNISTRNYDFDSNGNSVGIGYYGWDPVFLSWSRSRYEYPSQIRTFNSRSNVYSYVFGSNTVNQVFALEDERTTFTAGYFFSHTSLSLSHSRGRSAADQSISIINKAYLAHRISEQWTLKTTIGRSSIDGSNTSTTFASLGMSYHW